MPGRRIVLLEMSTEDAEEFVREVMTEPNVKAVATINGASYDATVEAVVARPRAWCKCDIPQESRGQRRRRQAQRREGGWMRGKALGWWMCVGCGKPSKAIVQHWITNMLAGANDLLPKILGTGDAIAPSARWTRDGGIPNPYADAKPAMPYEDRPVRKRKPRRSETDRIAREARP